MYILFGTLILFMLLGMPIAFTIGLSSLAWLVLESSFSVTVIPQRFFAGMNSWSLLAIPLFLLVGNLMNTTDITDRLVSFVNAIIGHITGGLALANVGVSMVFAGISGTALADTASIGAILIPAMKKEGYDSKYSAAVTVSSSIVGPIIPPSMPMILTGSILGLSIGRLFIAGAVPGVILGLALMITTYIIARRNNFPQGERTSFKNIMKRLKGSFFALVIPIVMVGGIVFGIFTPTEAGAIGVLSTLFVGIIIYRTVTFEKLYHSFVETAISSAAVLVLVGLANVFGWILSVERIPGMVTGWMLGITENETLLLLLILAVILFIGTFMETVAAILVVFPLLFEVATQIGMDPIHFGVTAVLALMIGLITPPLGVCLFVASSISKDSVMGIAIANMPYLITILVVLLLVAFIPAISLWLPGLFY